MQREQVVLRLLSEYVPTQLRIFDAAKARCYLDKDRQGLIAVIESGFGTLSPFNMTVRKLIAEKLGEQSTCRTSCSWMPASPRGSCPSSRHLTAM